MNLTRRHFLCVPLLAGLPVRATPAPLRMVVIDLMPWAGRKDDGQLTGVAVDFAALLSSASGQAIIPRAVPFARAIAMLNSGEADLMIAIAASSDPSLPPPLATVGTEDVVIVAPRGANYASADALCGRQIALLRRASFARSLHACIARYETNSYEQGLRMLRQGRVDGVAGVRSSMEYAIRQFGLKSSDFGAPLVVGQADISLYLSEHAATPQLAARLQQACAQLLRQKQMQALIAQYRLIQ